MRTETADQAFTRLSNVFANVVEEFVEPGQPYALTDFPAYRNVGDSAIWLGQLAFFDRYVGRPASFVCGCKDDPKEILDHVPDGPVFIQGGGNFGDIWVNHQKFRIRAWETLKGRPVIQLPQSIHFKDQKAADATARAIAAHGQVTLIVRDHVSYEFAQKTFDCDVRLSPDAAVNLHRLPAPDPTVPVISCLRDDRESVWQQARGYLESQGEVTDWQELNVWTLSDRVRIKLWGGSTLTRNAALRHREAMYRRQAHMRVTEGIRMMSPGKLIVTDRLHVHLISALIRRPHLVLDNSYGKIARHMEAWGNFDLGEKISDLDQLKAAVVDRTTA